MPVEAIIFEFRWISKIAILTQSVHGDQNMAQMQVQLKNQGLEGYEGWKGNIL